MGSLRHLPAGWHVSRLYIYICPDTLIVDARLTRHNLELSRPVWLVPSQLPFCTRKGSPTSQVSQNSNKFKGHTITGPVRAEEYVTPGMAAIIEIYVAIIGACLPILVPVYNKLRYNDPHHKSATSKGRTIGTTHTTDRPFVRRRVGSMGEGSFERLDNSSGQYEAAVYEQSHVSSTNWNRTDTSHTDIPLQGIAVKHEIVWTEGK